MAKRRLEKSLAIMKRDPPWGISGAPRVDNFFIWECFICGPQDTTWEGGIFELTMTFPSDHPWKPPLVQFKTPFFHPNVCSNTGVLHIETLSDHWSPALLPHNILLTIQSILDEPIIYANSPANHQAAKLYIDNKDEYDIKVRKLIGKHISKNDSKCFGGGSLLLERRDVDKKKCNWLGLNMCLRFK